MISERNIDIFAAGTEAIVNPVNCVGVMGKGLAKEFKARYPIMYKNYLEDCKYRRLRIGMCTIYKNSDYLIVNFPTKDHWKLSSMLFYIDQGLIDLRKIIIKWRVKSIALPRLGCGNGGLKYADVKELIYKHLSDLDCDITICTGDQ